MDDPLREPESERLSDLDRRIRERERRTPWVRLVILVLALVGILVFHQSISEQMAGCFGRYVAPPPTGARPDGDAEPTVRIEPARRLPSADAAPD